MYYIINGKKRKFGEEITFIEFIEELKKQKMYLNFENEDIIQKLRKLFNEITVNEGSLVPSNLCKTIRKMLGINSNAFTKNGLIDRGFCDDFIEKYFKENGKHWSNKNKKIIESINSTTYHYGKFSFFLKEKPKCQLCGSDLNFRLHNKNELEILSCKNENCPSKESTENKHKAFLPIDVNNAYKKERKKNTWTTIEYWTSRGYSEDEAKKKISEKQSICSKHVKNRPGCRKEAVLKKYGSNADFFLRKKSIWCKEYWTSRGYTEKEAEKKISEFQSEMSKRNLNKSIDERKKKIILNV